MWLEHFNGAVRTSPPGTRCRHWPAVEAGSTRPLGSRDVETAAESASPAIRSATPRCRSPGKTPETVVEN